jgi:hypothetical protein
MMRHLVFSLLETKGEFPTQNCLIFNLYNKHLRSSDNDVLARTFLTIGITNLTIADCSIPSQMWQRCPASRWLRVVATEP